MEKKAQIVLVVSVIMVLVVGFLIFWIFYGGNRSASTTTSSNDKKEKNEETIVAPGSSQTYTVEITSSGFSPQTLTIKQGDTVTWINKDSDEHWTASAIHPTHTVYPGVDYASGGSYQSSKGCSGKGQPKTGAFDACKGLKEGETFSFTFNQKGNWNYHDHLTVELYGKIIVQ